MHREPCSTSVTSSKSAQDARPTGFIETVTTWADGAEAHRWRRGTGIDVAGNFAIEFVLQTILLWKRHQLSEPLRSKNMDFGVEPYLRTRIGAAAGS